MDLDCYNAMRKVAETYDPMSDPSGMVAWGNIGNGAPTTRRPKKKKTQSKQGPGDGLTWKDRLALMLNNPFGYQSDIDRITRVNQQMDFAKKRLAGKQKDMADLRAAAEADRLGWEEANAQAALEDSMTAPSKRRAGKTGKAKSKSSGANPIFTKAVLGGGYLNSYLNNVPAAKDDPRPGPPMTEKDWKQIESDTARIKQERAKSKASSKKNSLMQFLMDNRRMLYTGGGALAGAGIGSLVSPKNRLRNALIGAVIGGGAGFGADYLHNKFIG